MTFEKANYIMWNFPRLTTHLEHAARRHALATGKLEAYTDGKTPAQDEEMRKAYLEEGMITEDSEVFALLKEGYEAFVIRLGERIARKHPKAYALNLCPKCQKLARTPYAKQCRHCGYSWHHEKMAELSILKKIKINDKSYLWIVGEIEEGHLENGFQVDLTPFQINKKPVIQAIKSIRRSVNGEQKDYKALGINVDVQTAALIEKYVYPSATRLMIVDERDRR